MEPKPPTTTSCPTKLTPIQGYISTLHRCHRGPEKCFDGNIASMCRSQNEATPWLAFEFQAQINVASVIIYNPPQYGNRTSNVELRVTDKLPPTIGKTMFREEGHLIGHFAGPGKDGEIIKIETGSSRSGRYLLIQMDKRGLPSGSHRKLNLTEVEVIGIYEQGKKNSLSDLTDKSSQVSQVLLE